MAVAQTPYGPIELPPGASAADLILPTPYPGNAVAAEMGIDGRLSGTTVATPTGLPALRSFAGMTLAEIVAGIIATFGAPEVVAAVAATVGAGLLIKWLADHGHLSIGGFPEALIPGQQAFAGEPPPGLGDIQGRLIRHWKAGLTWFAQFEQPSKRGSRIQYYAWSPRRHAWIPFRYRRNIVVGAKELHIAAILGHKRRLGKRRVLQTIAGHFSRRRQGRIIETRCR